MPGKDKIEIKKNKTREKIIESAAELFSRMNFHEVMMEDVAKLASIAKGTLYNYFNSKEDLYFSIMVTRMENLINSLREKIKKEETATDSLHTFVIHNYMFMVKYSCFFLMFQRDKLTADNSICSEFKSKKSELNSLLKEIIESGKEEKLFRNINTEFACDLVLGSLYGAVGRAIDNKFSKEVMDNERDGLYDFILKGVGSTASLDKTLAEKTPADKTQTEKVSSLPLSQLPLKSRNIVITRSVEDSKDSTSIFTEKGARVINFPTLEIVPPSNWSAFDEALKDGFDILVFTSANAVKMFIKRCDELNYNPGYEAVTVMTVGRKTAVLCEKNNIPVSLVPKEFSAEGLIKELSGYDFKGKTVLIPSSAIARDELPTALEKMGAVVKTPIVYNVAIPSIESVKPGIEQLNKIKPDLFIFTSPSTFRNFLDIMKITEPLRYFNGYSVAAIGPTTKTEIEKENVKVSILPDEYTMEGLLKAVVNFFTIN